MQERYRKYVERTFEGFQVRFAIIKGPPRFWDKWVLHDIMIACVIPHNMTVEDEYEESPYDIDSTQPSDAEEKEDDDA